CKHCGSMFRDKGRRPRETDAIQQEAPSIPAPSPAAIQANGKDLGSSDIHAVLKTSETGQGKRLGRGRVIALLVGAALLIIAILVVVAAVVVLPKLKSGGHASASSNSGSEGGGNSSSSGRPGRSGRITDP